LQRRENWGATAKAFEKFNLPIAPIVFLTRENVPEDKARVAKAFDIDVAIDDEYVNCIELEGECMTLHFIRQADDEDEGFYCVSDWKQIKQYIL